MSYRNKPWLVSYIPDVPGSINFNDLLCIPDFLERSTRDFPGLTALNLMGYTLTFRGLKNMADRSAAYLADYKWPEEVEFREALSKTQ